MNRLFRRVRHRAIGFGYLLLYAATTAAFYGGVQHYFSTNDFPSMAAVCGPVLAILFGLAALLYSRARALPRGPERRRSLFAAERAMQAACMFMLATALGGAGVLLLYVVPDIANEQVRPYLRWPATALIALAVLLFLLSFASFYEAVRAVAHTLVRNIPARRLSRRVREDT